MSPMNHIVALTLVALVATCALVSALPAQKQQGEQYEINGDGTVFPMTPTCKSNEKIVHGIPEEFQPTCNNSRPDPPKIIYQDLVSCFCADELVRNTAGECVALADCPEEKILCH